MISDLDRDVRLALANGFRGMRVTGEMSWALDLPHAMKELCAYERELFHRWPTQLGGLCQYDETKFPSDVIERMAGCHCAVVRDGEVTRHNDHEAHVH